MRANTLKQELAEGRRVCGVLVDVPSEAAPGPLRPLIEVCAHAGARSIGAGAARQALGMFGEQVVVGWLVLELTLLLDLMGLVPSNPPHVG